MMVGCKLGDTAITLDAVATGPSFKTWATSGVTFGGNANDHGVKDGIAFLLGAATPDENANGLLP